jgi:hypothetical protein
MIFNWLFRNEKPNLPSKNSTQWEYEYIEKPVYNHEEHHKETMAIIQDILDKLDDIKRLVDEMKENEGKK